MLKVAVNMWLEENKFDFHSVQEGDHAGTFLIKLD